MKLPTHCPGWCANLAPPLHCAARAGRSYMSRCCFLWRDLRKLLRLQESKAACNSSRYSLIEDSGHTSGQPTAARMDFIMPTPSVIGKDRLGNMSSLHQHFTFTSLLVNKSVFQRCKVSSGTSSTSELIAASRRPTYSDASPKGASCGQRRFADVSGTSRTTPNSHEAETSMHKGGETTKTENGISADMQPSTPSNLNRQPNAPTRVAARGLKLS